MMNKQEAIETIWYQMTEWLNEEELTALVNKYTLENITVFKRKSFNFFCRGHFPEEYLKMAEKVAEASLRGKYHKNDPWIQWDYLKEEFESANHPLTFVIKNQTFAWDKAHFIEQMVKANEPLLKKVHWIDEAIPVIRDEPRS